MSMLMVHIREVSMSMTLWIMLMQMAVLNTILYREIMTMQMMFIMSMFVIMFDIGMNMLMFMMLCQMQPDPNSHEAASNH